MKNLIARYAVLVLGLMFMALGISLSIRADLGITPISSPPYVLSLVPGWLSVGVFTIIMHVLFVLAQVAIRRGEFPPIQFLQLALGFIFGFFIDGANILTQGIVPSVYWQQIALVVLGSASVAVGVTLQVNAKAILVAGEGIMLAIADLLHVPFSRVKVCFDVSLVVISVVLSLLLFGEVRGVREGTVISAILVGLFAGRTQRLFGHRLAAWLDGQAGHSAHEAKKAIRVVTIGREFGSGGHEIGERLAARLGWSFVDQLLIDSVASQEGFSTDFVVGHDQQMTPAERIWKDICMDRMASVDSCLAPMDQLFVAQGRIIRAEVRRGPCVIVGRCANRVLADVDGRLDVFVSADMDFSVKRVMREFNLSEEKARAKIQAVNEARANHYNYYTGGQWGNASEYDLVLHSSAIGINAAVECIVKAVKQHNN